MASSIPADNDLRALVKDTLESQPEASFESVQNRLRAREGRVLETAEVERLHSIYFGEGFADSASTAASDRAARSASLASLAHARPNVKEITGLFAAIAPLFIHFQSNIAAK